MTGTTRRIRLSDNGLTLVEIMVALAIFSLVMTAVIKTFAVQQNTMTHIDQRSEMQMNGRNALHIIETHIQMIGFSPEGTLDGEEAMAFSKGGRADGGWLVFRRDDPDHIGQVQSIGIGLAAADDRQGGGRDGFADDRVGASGLIIQNIRAADNIVAVRFAYAFDHDGDGCVDLSAGGNIIWAIDTDHDGRLDTLLDTDDDGDVDADDAVGGADLGRRVDLGRIRAVKVWLLVRTACPLKGARDVRQFVVGGQRFAVDDYYGHELLETTVRCRNMLRR